MQPTVGEDSLLERESELARASALLFGAKAGDGRLLVVEGPPGIGKTALLARLSREAREAGFRALQARGEDLEREFPFGVARQLFEPYLHRLEASSRSEVLSGAALLAAPFVCPEAAAETVAADLHGAVHGLYWLTANVADVQPLLLLIDDLQWCDSGSLRYLVHLVRRLSGLTVLVAVSVRTAEPSARDELLDRLTAEPAAESLTLAPLTAAAVARILFQRLRAEPDPEFVAACHLATGGTPFLVHELSSTLARNGVAPSADAAARIGQVGPRAVARAIVARLARLPPTALALARALAILGPDGRLDQAAELAGLDVQSAVGAADSLVALDILRAGPRIEFVHSIVRSAIYETHPPAARAAAHGRAAAMLDAAGADLDSVAAHLLQAEPAGSEWTVERLRQASGRALARGAPESAASYLRRALEEGGLDAERRSAVLHELGTAERPLGPTEAIQSLRDALAAASDARHRARVAYDLADALFYVDRWEDAAAVVESALTVARQVDPELAVRLEALSMMQAFVDSRRIGVLARAPELRGLAGPETPGRRVMAVLLAALGALLGEPVEEVRRLVDVGLSGGLLLVEEPPESWVLSALYQALTLSDDLERGLRVVNEVADTARARGSDYGYAYNLGYRGLMHARRGDLAAAEADMRVTVPAIRENGAQLAEIGAPFFFIDPLLERPDLDDEAERLLALECPPELYTTVGRPMLLEARGRLRLSRGDLDGAVRDLEECGKSIYANGNPSGWGWRPALALAIGVRERERALALAGEEIQAAERVGLARAIGVGLRTLGLLESGEARLAHLHDAVAVLKRTPSRLEQARAYVELGGALRRANQRAAAREPLRQGLDLAVRCGAVRLADRARSELVAAGARPRRDALSGRAALTATEQRIATMASQGLSNPEIAQALFVTRKTVENHLGRIYTKLGINSRNRLREVLSPPDERA